MPDDGYAFFDNLVEFNPDDVDYSDTEDIRAGPMDEDDGELLIDKPLRLPRIPVAPERRSLESFDRERVICVHELARAMEEYATKEPVQLYGGSIEFHEAAQAVLEIAHFEKCGLKGH